MTVPRQKLPNQIRLRFEPTDSLGGFRDQINQEFIGSLNDLGPSCGDGFADNLGPLPRFDQIFGVVNRLAATHPFRRKVLHEPLFHDAGFLHLEVDCQEPPLFPAPRLQGQIEPPGPPVRQHGHRHVDLGDAPGRANPGDKLLTLVASALAGGDCIDDADVLRTGRTASAIGCVVKAPSTLGTFLRSFRWGHVRQLDRVSRELLARAWAAGGGPGDAPLTIDLDSTICETYGLGKEGARRHGYTGQRGFFTPS